MGICQLKLQAEQERCKAANSSKVETLKTSPELKQHIVEAYSHLAIILDNTDLEVIEKILSAALSPKESITDCAQQVFEERLKHSWQALTKIQALRENLDNADIKQLLEGYNLSFALAGLNLGMILKNQSDVNPELRMQGSKQLFVAIKKKVESKTPPNNQTAIADLDELHACYEQDEQDSTDRRLAKQHYDQTEEPYLYQYAEKDQPDRAYSALLTCEEIVNFSPQTSDKDCFQVLSPLSSLDSGIDDWASTIQKVLENDACKEIAIPFEEQRHWRGFNIRKHEEDDALSYTVTIFDSANAKRASLSILQRLLPKLKIAENNLRCIDFIQLEAQNQQNGYSCGDLMLCFFHHVAYRYKPDSNVSLHDKLILSKSIPYLVNAKGIQGINLCWDMYNANLWGQRAAQRLMEETLREYLIENSKKMYSNRLSGDNGIQILFPKADSVKSSPHKNPYSENTLASEVTKRSNKTVDAKKKTPKPSQVTELAHFSFDDYNFNIDTYDFNKDQSENLATSTFPTLGNSYQREEYLSQDALQDALVVPRLNVTQKQESTVQERIKDSDNEYEQQYRDNESTQPSFQ